ncbi:hypothetical protein [Laribacter hongkongensis]|uniref:Transposase n=1 Tax=Laribacter hongkongensis TaxID=168471 RepID=A0ABD4STJ8_9NEIS|nr:hypothetical protein [Laribacter hongkongensis]MCG9026938.1 hypothetical protein [Laribacter hongkongensis]MCG9100294.1 hypothetical protein [Laribacter hongkongensis]MCG9119654.1 hypothetical protein [Laribacter hongkongensis]
MNIRSIKAGFDDSHIQFNPDDRFNAMLATYMISKLFYELTNWLDEICIARTRHNPNP